MRGREHQVRGQYYLVLLRRLVNLVFTAPMHRAEQRVARLRSLQLRFLGNHGFQANSCSPDASARDSSFMRDFRTSERQQINAV